MVIFFYDAIDYFEIHQEVILTDNNIEEELLGLIKARVAINKMKAKMLTTLDMGCSYIKENSSFFLKVINWNEYYCLTVKKIRAKGAQIFGEALQTNITLTELNLRSNIT